MSSDIWNPWHGCRKYSEGCDHCYMYYLDNERGKSGGEIYKVKTNSDLSSSVYHTKCKKRICTPPAGGKDQSSGNSSSANSASVSSFSFSMTCFVDKPQPGAGVVEHGDNAQSSQCRHGLHCLHGLDLVYAEKGPLAAADPRSRRM